MESRSAVPTAAKAREEWTFLPDGRWIERIVSTNNGSYVAVCTNRYVWDGNVLLAVLNHTNGLELAFMRGLDMSGTLQGAGGVGGLLAVQVGSAGPAGFGGHRSLCVLRWQWKCGGLGERGGWRRSARYETGPFGEPLRVTGPMAKVNPLRFSTQYADDVAGDIKYLYRDYTASTGRWLSRDPIGEEAFLAQMLRGRPWPERERLKQVALGPAYVFSGNDAQNRIDLHGLTFADVVRKRVTGRLPKMVGIDLAGATVVGVGGAQAWSLQAAFFADTCEIAAFGVGPAVIETSKDTNRPAWKLALLDMPVGLDASISINGSVAQFSGSGRASAGSWKGIFYGGQVGGGPLSGGLFWDPDPSDGLWVGVSAGVGLSAFPISARTNPQVYYMIGTPFRVPACLCYLLIWRMP